MAKIGFSTGAVALADFKGALERLSELKLRAVELSALRAGELRTLMQALPTLDLSGYDYVSVHAPSRFDDLTEAEAAEALQPCIERRIPIVLHPDAIRDFGCWHDFGSLLLLENMDKRKHTGRTADELDRFFEVFPNAGLCLDLAHAAQVDTTMSVAREILCRYGKRLVQLHISELDARGGHHTLSMSTVAAVRRVGHRIKPNVVAIIESHLGLDDRLRHEVDMVERALRPNSPRRLEQNSSAAREVF